MKAKLLASATCAGLFLIAAVAQADPVTYGTYGTFANVSAGGGVLSNTSVDGGTSSVTKSSNDGSDSFTFTGKSIGTTAPDDGSAEADFGQFALHIQANQGSTSPDLQAQIDGATFTLYLTQSVPTVGGGSTSSTFSVTGSLSVNKKSDESFVISLSLPSFTIPPIGTPSHTYSFDAVNWSDTIPSSAANPVTFDSTWELKGPVTDSAVPLPAAAMGGFALLGLLGVSRIRRSAITN